MDRFLRGSASPDRLNRLFTPLLRSDSKRKHSSSHGPTLRNLLSRILVFLALITPFAVSASLLRISRASSANAVLENTTRGIVWNDLNRNGIRDNGEPGIGGATVNLIAVGLGPVESTNTGASGLYQFSSLSEGDYSIQVILPSGYTFTAKDQGNDDSVDSDVDAATEQTDQFHLPGDASEIIRDAGLTGTYVGGRAFNDTNRNGLQDAGEVGLGGVTVRLLDGDDTIATNITANDGSYKFEVTTEGPHSIEFVAPHNYAISPQDRGSDDTLDSDPSDIPASLLPQNWIQERSSANPVVPLGAGDINTIDEQYQPTVIRVQNGDIWIYVKGTRRIYAFRSTDNGETFAIQNGGSPVLDPGMEGDWDDGFVIDPCAVYEPETDTIHLYYKGGHYDTNDLPALYLSTGWGHATASGSSPTIFNKDAGPVLTAATALAALGASDVVDLRLASVIKIGGTFYFYGDMITGTSYVNGSDYLGRIFYATGDSWTSPIVQDYAFPNHSDNQENNGWVHMDPMVYQQPGSPVFTMLYSEGEYYQGEGLGRHIRVATSQDGRVWKQTPGTFLSSTNNSWEAQMVYGSTILRKSSGGFTEPDLMDGKYLIYYSGLNLENQAASGLVRVVPEPVPDPLIGKTEPFTVMLGETDTTRDAGMYVREGAEAGASTIFVDDGFAGCISGQDPDGLGPATKCGVDAFATIQAGVDAAGAGAAVRIAAGTYVESPVVYENTTVVIEGPVTLSGNLTVTKGTLVLNAVINSSGVVAIGANGYIARNSGYIIGSEKLTCNAPGKFSFYVGTSNGYSPADVTVTSGGGDLTVFASQGPLPLLNAEKSLQRFWTLTGSGQNVKLTVHYSATDVRGDEAHYTMMQVDDASFVSYPETIINSNNPNDHTATLGGVSSVSHWTLGEPAAQKSGITGRIMDADGNPVEGAAVRLSGPQDRLTVTDVQGNYRFPNVDLNGVYTVTPSRPNFIINPAARAFTQFGLHTDASFVASRIESVINPLDTTEYFVRQQYLDFLNREPDEAGFAFWIANIENCGADPLCREVQRINTSAAFFLSIEFQQTGFFVYRIYQAAYGDMSDAPVPLKLSEFNPDTREIGAGVVVNQIGWETILDHNRQAYLTRFVQSARFTSCYPLPTGPAEFVDRLFANAGVTPAAAEREAALNEFGQAVTTEDVSARVRVMQRVVDDPATVQKQFNKAFVLMQYFGYLRRDANALPDGDFAGFDFWLSKLDRFNGNYRDAEMVKAFLDSIEYRGRFPR